MKQRKHYLGRRLLSLLLCMITIVVGSNLVEPHTVNASSNTKYLSEKEIRACESYLGYVTQCLTNSSGKVIMNNHFYGELAYYLINSGSWCEFPVNLVPSSQNTTWGQEYKLVNVVKMLTGILGKKKIRLAEAKTSGLTVRGDKLYVQRADGDAYYGAMIVDVKRNSKKNLVVTGYSYKSYDVYCGYVEKNGISNYSPAYMNTKRFVATYVPDTSCYNGYRLASIKAVKTKNPKVKLNVSSTLIEPGYNHSKSNLIDGNVATAWVEGNKKTSIGEKIEITFNKPTKVYGVMLSNGYFKSATSFYNNQRMYSLTMRAGNVKKSYTCADFYTSVFPDDKVWYTDAILFDQPVTTKKVTLTVDAVNSGKKYSDLCVSELLVLQ